MQDRPNKPDNLRNKLPRSRILRGTDVFNRVFSNGKRLSGSIVDTRFLFIEEGTQQVKAGFAAGKKTGNAPFRNRCKRLMREAYRKHQQELTLAFRNRNDQKDLHLVFSIKRGIPAFDGVENDIRRHLEEIRQVLRL